MSVKTKKKKAWAGFLNSFFHPFLKERREVETVDTLQANIIRHTRRLIVLVVGLTLLIIGIAMIFLPGPALIVIPFSLVVLGSEFIWARRLLRRMKRETDRLKLMVKEGADKFRERRAARKERKAEAKS